MTYLRNPLLQNEMLPVDIVMVDNFPPARLLKAVRFLRRWRPDVEIEASGGVTLKTVARIAKCGVDRISVGALTHSAPAVDIALEWIAPSSS